MTFIELEVTVDNNEPKRNECYKVLMKRAHHSLPPPTTTLHHSARLVFLFASCASFSLFFRKSSTHSFLSTSLETTIKLLLLALLMPLFIPLAALCCQPCYVSTGTLCLYCSILLLCILALMKRHDETMS